MLTLTVDLCGSKLVSMYKLELGSSYLKETYEKIDTQGVFSLD